jgi:hypothetical protein
MCVQRTAVFVRASVSLRRCWCRCVNAGDCKHACSTSRTHALEGFQRRRAMLATPLALENGLASVILENPYCAFDGMCCAHRTCV